MKDKNKQVKRKWLLRMMIYLLLGFLLGVFGSFFAGSFSEFKLTIGNVTDFVLLLSRVSFVIVLLIAFFFLIRAYRFRTDYEEADENDDILIDKLYNALYRNMEYATIASNVAMTFAIVNLLLGFQFITSADGFELRTSVIDYIFFLVLIVSQVFLFKLIGKVRKVKLSVFSTVKEVKDYVYSVDEGERQASFEQSFLTLFNLNQKVLPALYFIIFLVSLITQTHQLLAYIVVAFIHIYINIAQYQMVRKYFR